MTQTALVLPGEVTDETSALYVSGLMDLTVTEIRYAFAASLKDCLFFPKIAELREFAMHLRKSQANKRVISETAKMLKRPDDFNFRVEDAYDEIDRRAIDLREKDKAFVLLDSDHVWPKVGDSGRYCRCPKHGVASGSLYWVCYDRIMDAKRDVTLVPASAIAGQLSKLDGESKVPRDPVERAGWARRQAVAQGWAERQPGDEENL